VEVNTSLYTNTYILYIFVIFITHDLYSNLCLILAGAIMEEHAGKLMDLKICSFLPKHNHNLANEFRCYVNYESSLLS